VDDVTQPPARRSGRVVRVNGPLVEAEGLEGVAMLDVVGVGPQALPAEVVAMDDGTTTMQAYEYTGGIKVGDVVTADGRPLSAPLGPGLLGQVFDGLLRPLSTAPTWLTADRSADSGGSRERWTFVRKVAVGDHVEAGDILGVVPEIKTLEYRVLVPPKVSGVVTWLAAEDIDGVGSDDPVARIDDTPVFLTQRWAVRRARPYLSRVDDVVPLHTGQRILDLIFPLAQGGAAAVPGGFGTGKTLLLQQLAKWCDAEVIVYIGCGERGNEMADVLAEFAELADPRTGGLLLGRTVIIANTSNMPMMARESSVYSGITVAEHFRDMGYSVVVIADSTSRWAEALREFASRNGALPAEEGYPAELGSALAAFYERAGRVRTLGGRFGAVTVVGAVSPPGGDMTEPVTTATVRFVRTLWSLDHDLAYARHYPAISWASSFSRDADAIGTWHASDAEPASADPGWVDRRARAIALLADADRIAALAEVVGSASLPGPERVAMLVGHLLRDGVLMQSALSPNDAYCSGAKGAALLDLVLAVSDACQSALARGVEAAVLERLDWSGVLRAREESGPADADAVRLVAERMVAELAAVE
jgi:V/A-type H+/Na+-transporting ATPase subunit A